MDSWALSGGDGGNGVGRTVSARPVLIRFDIKKEGMVKVYVVTSGSYSDYRIEEIFKKKVDAEALASVLSDGNGVDEWEVNTRRVVPLWSIWMKRNGDLDEEYGGPHVNTGCGEDIYTYEDGSGEFSILADTLERAIKVANERRAIILSHNLWGDNEKIKELFLPGNEVERVREG